MPGHSYGEQRGSEENVLLSCTVTNQAGVIFIINKLSPTDLPKVRTISLPYSIVY